jgi:hypothetical protein
MIRSLKWLTAFIAAPIPQVALPSLAGAPPKFTACTWCGLHHDPFAHCQPSSVARDLMTNTRARELVHDAANRVSKIADSLADTKTAEALHSLASACRLLADVTAQQDGDGRP